MVFKCAKQFSSRSWRSMCLYLAFCCISSSIAEASAEISEGCLGKKPLMRKDGMVFRAKNGWKKIIKNQCPFLWWVVGWSALNSWNQLFLESKFWSIAAIALPGLHEMITFSRFHGCIKVLLAWEVVEVLLMMHSLLIGFTYLVHVCLRWWRLGHSYPPVMCEITRGPGVAYPYFQQAQAPDFWSFWCPQKWLDTSNNLAPTLALARSFELPMRRTFAGTIQWCFFRADP